MAVYRAAIRTVHGDEDYFNVLHLYGAATDPGAIADQFVLQAATVMTACMSNTVTLKDITVTRLDDNAQETAVCDIGGSVASEMAAPQLAYVISWRTAYVGRRNRGRMFVPGVTEGSVSGGLVTAGHKVLLGNLATALRITWPNNCGAVLVLRHKVDGTTTAILDHIIRDVVYTQRRRTLGVGT